MLGAQVQSLVRELDPTSHNQEFKCCHYKIPHATIKMEDPMCCT